MFNNGKFFGRFISSINTQNRLITFQNTLHFNNILSYIRGQRLPLPLFSQATSLNSSLISLADSKTTISMKDLFSLLQSTQCTNMYSYFLLVQLSKLSCLGDQIIAMRKVGVLSVGEIRNR